MEITAWVVVVGVLGGAGFLLKSLFTGRRDAGFDAGSVSQSWITEHRVTDERHN